MKKLFITAIAASCLVMAASGANKKTVTKSSNPFMAPYTTQFAIPPFEKIKYEHYLPAVEAGIAEQNSEIKAIVDNKARPDFDNTILAIDNSGATLNRVSSVFFALSESDATPEMVKLAEQIMPMVTAQNDEIYMNGDLFKKVKEVYDNKKALGITAVQERLVDKIYKRFVRNGALLNAAQQDTLKAINTRSAALMLKFGNNVMREIATGLIWVDNESMLSGLPQSTIGAAKALAEANGSKAPWAFNASNAMRLAVLSSADDRSLREKMYKTYITTANRGGDNDNKQVINEILQLRQRKAQLLGFDSFADYATDPVMAKTVDAAQSLLMQIFVPATEKVKEEVADMQKYANAHGANIKIEPWDYYYYADKVKAERYSFTDDEVRPYFEFNNVIKNGVFYAANKLYGITFTEMKKAPKYHPEVTVYDVKDKNGKHLAVFMTDYFPRDVKAQGAWMNEMATAYNYNGKVERPIVYNVGSFTPPTKDQPSLLTLDEVETAFHEFGHALQGMLTQAPFKGIAGTNVDRDFVEVFSQINEHWAYVPEVLKNYAKHYKTGEVIPQQLLDKILESRKFNQGFMTTELVGAALLDLEWHKVNYAQGIDVNAFEQHVRKMLHMPAEVGFRYRSTYFKHLFSDEQYAAGYYTYLWSQVLEADGWERFEQEGAFSPAAAAALKFVLEAGDTIDAMELYKGFRGHEPTADALLRQRGLK